MLVAVIGGTRHIGPSIVELLVEAGHEVQVYNRGRTPAQLPPGVQRVTIDRTVPGQLAAALRNNRPDAIIDMIGYVSLQVLPARPFASGEVAAEDARPSAGKAHRVTSLGQVPNERGRHSSRQVAIREALAA